MISLKLNTNQVNYLNIALMLISAACAFAFPFETFLVVYAVLGPLHYLTEISWLHDRKYFTQRKYDYLFLIAAGILITVGAFRLIPGLSDETSTALTFVAFCSALLFVLTKDIAIRVVGIGVLLAISGSVVQNVYVDSIFSIYLPTLIHVFLFTGLFILVGALRGRSFSGIASLVVFILCALSFFYLFPERAGYVPSANIKSNYQDFQLLNYYLMTPFANHDLNQPANIQQYIQFVNSVLYQSQSAFAVMAFIGFAYMYHYLNWFSKTSIIQWHNIPRSRLIAIIVIWMASLGLYAYSYTTGLKWLFFLSFSHVLLEFPLDHLTFINIGKEFGKIFAGKRVAVAK